MLRCPWPYRDSSVVDCARIPSCFHSRKVAVVTSWLTGHLQNQGESASFAGSAMIFGVGRTSSFT